MASDFLAPGSTTVIGRSVGYDGDIAETDVPEWQNYLGGAGAVRDAGDWRVSGVSNAAQPIVQIAPGQGGKDGVVDTTTEIARLSIPVPAGNGEYRNYFVVVARDWRPTPGGTSGFVLRDAGSGQGVPLDAPSVLRNPGVQSDQVLALVQVVGGSSTVQTIQDRRLTASKVYTALGVPPAPSLLPYGAQVLIGPTQDPQYVTRGPDGNKAYTRYAQPSIRSVGVSGGVFPGLPDSTRRPGGGIKAWGDTRRDVASVTIDSPVPYRVSGLCHGSFGADDNSTSTATRWDWLIRGGTDGPTIGLWTPQGFTYPRDETEVRFRQIPIPVTADVFTGRTVFVLQAVRVAGNALAAISTSSFSFTLAVHPA